MEFRLWIGLWSAFFCLVLVATDASFLVKYFTRFTEEGFSCLISFIFIYDAFKKMIKLAHHYPINSEYNMENITQYECLCMAPSILENESELIDDPVEDPSMWYLNYTGLAQNQSWSRLTKSECLMYKGELVGKACNYVPDITLMSFILFFGTYTTSMCLKKFKTSPFFPTTRLVCAPIWRKPLVGLSGLWSPCPPRHHSDLYGPTDHCCDCQQEGAQAKGLCVSAAVLSNCPWPSMLSIIDLVCCLDQKGAGYHLDLFWVAVLMVVCSFMGLPWYVAATVISIAHIDSLKMETETSAPGEQPKFLGVR
ncbi:hypothetical protein GOODEAATRI_019815 [Goodea atripinnis]|uniref:Bicarbonate transporter-like transmembrane domain-containing protein n=1 Tax=Goodea atripinnis TaxID=208336 RepID=A0ABV0N2T9_9TELE